MHSGISYCQHGGIENKGRGGMEVLYSKNESRRSRKSLQRREDFENFCRYKGDIGKWYGAGGVAFNIDIVESYHYPLEVYLKHWQALKMDTVKRQRKIPGAKSKAYIALWRLETRQFYFSVSWCGFPGKNAADRGRYAEAAKKKCRNSFYGFSFEVMDVSESGISEMMCFML